MFRRERKLIPLLGQPCQFEMCAEIIRRRFKRLRPPRDPVAKRLVYILESLLGRCVARLAQPVENPPRFHLLLRFIAKKSVLKRYMRIRRIEPHHFRELIARLFAFPNLQQRIGKIFAKRHALRIGPNRPLKERNRFVIMPATERRVSLVRRLIGRRRLTKRKNRATGAKRQHLEYSSHVGHRSSAKEEEEFSSVLTLPVRDLG